MHYEVLGDPIFREREVPRDVELSHGRLYPGRAIDWDTWDPLVAASRAEK
jgi:hypothetical protein